ncbi:lipopolysaccharide biosynthesis protein [Sphingomonas sp. DT-204]|uniref:lipopolysaccharide biosynthesis protein n=1 Tax=Sphingomonas sp. DT-204 TaxID=3396166 RepID=UPI003F199C34
MDGVGQLPEGGEPAVRFDETGSRSRLRINVIANYLGRGWATAISLFCLPLFLWLLGSEAYGLIGAYVVVQAWVVLVDLGITPTLNREIARARTGARSWQSFSNLVRSAELLVIALATLIALIVYLAAPLLATEWLKPRQLSTQTVTDAISIMGVLAAVRWIEIVYRGAIQGSEDQVWLNLVQAGAETARWIGGLLIIACIDANVLLIFVWNLLVSTVSAAMLRRRVITTLRRHAPQRPRADWRELREIRGFAGGMFLSSVLIFLLTQADKLVVGAQVPLADFGIYALAATAAAGLAQLVQPMSVAVLPRFTTSVTSNRRADLVDVFHTASEWLCAILLPLALLVIILPERTLLAWTGQPAVATAGAPILSLLVLASLLNLMTNIPYMLQLAHGWTSLTNKVNAVAILLLLPLLIWMTKIYAGVGAAAALAGVNLIVLIVMPCLVIPRLLPGELLRWFGRSVLVPSILGAAVAVGLRLMMPAANDRVGAIVQLGISGAAVGFVVLASLRHPRDSVLAYLRSRW